MVERKATKLEFILDNVLVNIHFANEVRTKREVCDKCGSKVVGRYCSNCGKRVRGEIEKFRQVERATMKEYEKTYSTHGDLETLHLAKACWLACLMKYGSDMVTGSYAGGYSVSPNAYDTLETVKRHAAELCNRLLAADDY